MAPAKAQLPPLPKAAATAKGRPKHKLKKLRVTVGELEFSPPPGFKVVHTSPHGIDMEIKKEKVPWYLLSVTSRELGNRSTLSQAEVHQLAFQWRDGLQKPGPMKFKPTLVRGYAGYLLDYSGVSGKTRLHARQLVWLREGLLTVVSCICEEKQQQRSGHFLLTLIAGSRWGPDHI